MANPLPTSQHIKIAWAICFSDRSGCPIKVRSVLSGTRFPTPISVQVIQVETILAHEPSQEDRSGTAAAHSGNNYREKRAQHSSPVLILSRTPLSLLSYPICTNSERLSILFSHNANKPPPGNPSDMVPRHQYDIWRVATAERVLLPEPMYVLTTNPYYSLMTKHY